MGERDTDLAQREPDYSRRRQHSSRRDGTEYRGMREPDCITVHSHSGGDILYTAVQYKPEYDMIMELTVNNTLYSVLYNL